MFQIVYGFTEGGRVFFDARWQWLAVVDDTFIHLILLPLHQPLNMQYIEHCQDDDNTGQK